MRGSSNWFVVVACRCGIMNVQRIAAIFKYKHIGPQKDPKNHNHNNFAQDLINRPLPSVYNH